jgi:replicative DNA helicase
MDGSNKELTENAIPQMLQEALAVSFDVAVGHDYIDDAEARYDYYTAADEKIPFDLDALNKVTKGGMRRKAIYCVAAQSGGGKSIFLCHAAAAALREGKNVLYITLEMSEESISQRIDANLMNVPVDDLEKMTRDEFMTKIDKIRSKTNGRLKVKEYAAGAHAGHFRALFEELKTKQNFVPDLLVIDYLGICGSSRMRMGGSVNTNSFLRAVAEELRGLGKENNIPVLTGAQLNRGGYDNSDLSMSDIAESIGVAMTLDFFFALIATSELEEVDQVMVQILKNRYGLQNKFLLGLTKKKMQFYNLEESAQNTYIADIPKKPKTLDGTSHEIPIFKAPVPGSYDTSVIKF